MPMKSFLIYFWLLLFFAAKQITLYANPLVISLGTDCQVADNLRDNNLRFQAYPFDWNRTLSFDSIVKIIEDDFKHWLDPEVLEYRERSIYNNFYKIEFFHDFPTKYGDEIYQDGVEIIGGILDPDFEKYIPMVESKYRRRIDRFKEALNSNGPIFFIRSYATPKSAKKFVKLIKSRYPNLNFQLIALIGELNYENKTKNYYKNDWKIDNVQVIYCHGTNDGRYIFPEWWNPEVWTCVFRYLGLIN